VARVAAECPLAGGLPTGGARAGSPATDGPPTALSRLQGRTARKTHCLGPQAVGRACYIGI